MSSSISANTKASSDDKGAICNAYPLQGKTCKSKADCPDVLACKAGKCTTCTSDGECGASSFCDGGTCQRTCKVTADCKGGMVCKAGKCGSCGADSECPNTAFCEAGRCMPKCKSDADCSTDEKCAKDGRCVARGKCTTNDHCKDGEYCEDGSCIPSSALGKPCQGEADCVKGQVCLPHDGKSFCSTACKAGSKPCPKGHKCVALDSQRSFCHPEAAPPKSDGGGTGADGGPVGDKSSGGSGSSGDSESSGCSCGVGSGPWGPLSVLLLLVPVALLRTFRKR